MNTVPPRLVLFLADVTARVTVLLALTALIAILSRRASASGRHLVWVLGLGCALCLPVLSWDLPHWRVPVPVAPTHTAPAAMPPSPVAPPLLPMAGAVTPHAPPPAQEVHGQAAPAPQAPGLSPAPAAITASVPPRAPGITWNVVALLTWATGAVFLLARLAGGLIAVRGITGDSLPVGNGPLADAARSAADALRLPRPVGLRLASPAGRVAVPLTFGLLRPVVVLPVDAGRWPAERLRAALLHESAHVRRGDWTLQMLGQLTVALYWFHPLAWVALRRMRAEAEAACDDLVLAAGVPAPEYARHLLDVALSARALRRLGTGAVAMAQGPRVEGRLRAVLAQGLSRRPLTRRFRGGALAAALLLIVPVASLHFVHVARASDSATAAITTTPNVADAAQAAPGGGTVRLVGVSYSPSRQSWWDKGGRLLPGPPASLTGQSLGTITGMANQQIREFVLAGHGIGADASFALEVPQSGSTSTWVNFAGHGASHGDTSLGIVAALPASARTCTVRVGVAAEPWNTAASDDGGQIRYGESLSTSTADGESLIVMFSPATTVRGGLAFTVSDTVSGRASRIVALDTHGRVVVPDTLSSSGAGTMTQRTVVFPALRLGDIKSIQLQARAYRWVEFQNVQLQPQTADSGAPGQAGTASRLQVGDGPWSWIVLPTASTNRPLTFQDREGGKLSRILRAEGGYDQPTRTLRQVTLTQYRNRRITQTTQALTMQFHAPFDTQALTGVMWVMNGVSTRVYGADGKMTYQIQGRVMTGREPTASPTAAPTQPDTAAAHVAQGLQLQQRGQPRDGIPDFRRAVQLDPNDADAQFQFAQALYQINWKHIRTHRGDTYVSVSGPPAVLDEAILHMQRAAALQPGNEEWHSALGTYLVDRGRYAEAVAEYRQALHLLPASKPFDLDRTPPSAQTELAQSIYDANWTLGDALLKTRQYSTAVAHYQQALHFHPKAVWVLLGLGDALRGEGQRIEARAVWKQVAALDPATDYYGRQARARLTGQ